MRAYQINALGCNVVYAQGKPHIDWHLSGMSWKLPKYYL